MQINDVKELLNSRVLHSEFVSGISRQLSDYEKRVKSVVHEIDLKSRDAREKSRKRLDVFASQVKKTRVDLEKRVVTMVNGEAQRLNRGLTELVDYLKTLSAADLAKPASRAKKGGKKTAAPKRKTAKKDVARKVMASKKSGTAKAAPTLSSNSLSN